MSQQGDNRSLFGRTNAEENRQSFSDEKVTSSAREQREDRHDARKQREDRQQERRQREQRYQGKGTKDKSPFDGSLLEVKPADVSR